MWTILMINLVISGLLYIEALKWGMPAKRWWCAGVVFGVASLPMYSIAKHIHWRRAVGFNNLYMAA
ncbi:hypothetical protein EP13_06505 [Alteromonas australica]|uniref:Uncharacterized protein n=2 Tax=Alteromonas australica TaxID=589873 RepID=A0A075NXU8_9ALTE|nr:hypothetical protein EP13_06505 [Alteromonas australica]|tara:strand:+ start:770 stop:967 length:198 start_codon:yes stop_codon:yes gene_type:complete